MSSSTSSEEEEPAKIVFIPDPCYVLDTWEHSIPCQGCRRLFPCQVKNSMKFPSPKYFTHCVERCKRYNKLKLTRECEDCWSVFVDENLYNSHFMMCPVIAERNLNIHKIKGVNLDYSQDCKEPKTDGENQQENSGEESDLELTVDKEAWVISVPEQSLECEKFKEKLACLGCGKLYPGTKIKEKVIQEDGTEVVQDNIIGRRDYYNHCIFKCSQYQNLNLTCLCLRCNKIYLDPDEFVTHKQTSCNVALVTKNVQEPKNRQESFNCPRCPAVSVSLKALRQHFSRKHGYNEIDAKSLEVLNFETLIHCDICHKIVFTEGGLKLHRKSHFKEEPGTSSDNSATPEIASTSQNPTSQNPKTSKMDRVNQPVKVENELEENQTTPQNQEESQVTLKTSEKVATTSADLETESTENEDESGSKPTEPSSTDTIRPEDAEPPPLKPLAGLGLGKLPKSGFKCELCSRKFLDKRLLAAHQKLHRKRSSPRGKKKSEQGKTESVKNSPTSKTPKQIHSLSLLATTGNDRDTNQEQIEETKTEPSFSNIEMDAVIDCLSPINIDPLEIAVSDDTNQCSSCFSSHQNRYDLKVHFLDSHYNQEFDCPNCNFSFLSIASLANHYVHSHEFIARMTVKNFLVKKRKSGMISILAPMLPSKKNKSDPQPGTSSSVDKSHSQQTVNTDTNLDGLDQLSTIDDYICLGCKEKFPISQMHVSRFYQHCIFECEEYGKLNLSRTCDVCRGTFMNQQLLDNHKLNFCQITN